MTSVQSVCIPLTTSAACPSFSQFQVDTNAVANVNVMAGSIGISLNSFMDVKSMDLAIFNSTAFMSSPSTCTGYNPAQRIRYQDSILCTVLVQDKTSVACAKDTPNLCISSCTLFANNLKAMITKTCPSDGESLKRLNELNATCNGESKSWSGLQGSDSSCINATTNEAASCAGATCVSSTTSATTATGVLPPVPTTDNNDSNSDKSLSTSEGPGGLSTAALGGIIGGGVALLLLVFGLVCCIRRSKSTGSSKNNTTLARHMSNSSASKYKISAPKIQEEGFSTALPPSTSTSIPMTALPIITASDTMNDTTTAAMVAAAANRLSKQSGIAGGKQSYCQALYPYQASMADELDLTPGDIVSVDRVFDDGWAVGMNMNTSNEGAFPVVCVMFVDESALDDDFEDVNMHSMTPIAHREDDLANKSSSPRSSMPSRASSPVHLPRRHSSMIRDSAILPPGGLGATPVSSSPLAGGNGQGNLQLPVRDTIMSDSSSLNRWWEGEGSSIGK
ncbi:hypothetical protein BGZ65_003479 [Modicella reniformis]|uniref:SH3 domain-containing protein n=1 Tax=Modicella reniformis TaxID=1440133 RepID=A0A9P6STI3_9FUNG|nr:hypothetical protein BGZ65_003479 [Modicella reniformis]